MALPEEYSLTTLAKNYGLKKIIFSPDLFVAFFITFFIGFFYLPNASFNEMASSISLELIGANAGLLGIVLAGFAIIISLLKGDFEKIIKKAGLYEDTVFLFTYDSLLIGLGLVFSICFSISIPLDFIYSGVSISLYFSKIFFTCSIFFSTYGLFSVVFLLFHMKNLAMLKGEMEED